MASKNNLASELMPDKVIENQYQMKLSFCVSIFAQIYCVKSFLLLAILAYLHCRPIL